MPNGTPAAQHMFAAFRVLYRDNTAPQITRFPSGGLMLATGEADPFGNFAIGLSQQEMPSAARTLSQSDVPAVFLESVMERALVETAVNPFGFVHAASIPAMSVSLSALARPGLPPGYVLERVGAEADPHPWSRTLSEGYPVAPLAANSMSPVCASVHDELDASHQFFQVRHGSDVVGVSLLVLAEGLAGVYCVATLPEHRGKGLGAVLTAAPLIAARDLGFETGVLQASEAGYSVYRRLGFQDDGTVEMYLRAPEAHEPA